MDTTHTVMDSPIGALTLTAEDGGLTGLYFPRHRGRPGRTALGRRSDRDFERAVAQLTEYFAGQRTGFALPFNPRGDDFQCRVWDLVASIPYGQTRSYGELAAELGDPQASREVGAVNGQNPLCVLVPCHRVIGADGRLTGYAGGLDRKRFLLDLEEPAEVKAARLF